MNALHTPDSGADPTLPHPTQDPVHPTPADAAQARIEFLFRGARRVGIIDPLQPILQHYRGAAGTPPHPEPAP